MFVYNLIQWCTFLKGRMNGKGSVERLNLTICKLSNEIKYLQAAVTQNSEAHYKPHYA